jgi:hypothetical protein
MKKQYETNRFLPTKKMKSVKWKEKMENTTVSDIFLCVIYFL